MGRCQFCQTEIKELDKPGFVHHLQIIKTETDGHIHVHGDLENRPMMKELIEAAEVEIGIDRVSKKQLEKTEYVFHNRQRIGDILTFTCAIRDFKKEYPNVRVNVISTCGHIWDHNPNIDRTLIPTPENTVRIGPGKGTNISNRIDWHMTNAFRLSIEDNLGIQLQQGESRPDLWLTEEEYNAPRLFEKPYWIICTTGEKGWGCKMYPHEKWQQFVESHPDKLFVQIGTKEDNAERLKGENIIDYIGKTQSREDGVRDLFKLFLNAEGSIGLVSFHMHLSGALYKPCIVIAGGREPVSFTRYEGHRYLSDDGCLPCSVKACWHCSIDACTNPVLNDQGKKIPKCVDIIDVEDLNRAMNMYYRGGRLKIDTPIEKTPIRTPSKMGVNVVPTPRKIEIPKEKEPATANIGTYGMPFGGGSLTQDDWGFIQSIIDKYGVKSVLEFGAGLSTLLLRDKGVELTTFETNQNWINKILAFKPDSDIRLWDGKGYLPENLKGSYDLSFVDGPSGGVNRECSTKIASVLSDIVVVHDAGREWEKQWQKIYLEKEFDGPLKGGHRCHLWIRKGSVKVSKIEATIEVEKPISKAEESQKPEEALSSFQQNNSTFPTSLKSKFIKIVSTARGWGGCARSVTTIMKMLIKNGHKVEFIPFRNSVTSGEFKHLLETDLKDVKVSLGFGTLKEQCDALLMYADDYVWEFAKPEMVEIFSNIGADYKVMMLNFRRGRVGIVDWTKGWDKYMFLCSWQEKDLLNILPGVKTKVLPPCTDLTEFLNVNPDYHNPNSIRIVRHSSQGDSKFPETFGTEVINALECRSDLSMSLLPGPSFVNLLEPLASRFVRKNKTANVKELAEYLATGNLFWYSVPPRYMDMGPRVIVEAMAVGLPVIADDWIGGPTDRLTPETGWLCSSKEQHIEIMKNITTKELERMGIAAKERAFQEFRPEAWLKELVGGK